LGREHPIVICGKDEALSRLPELASTAGFKLDRCGLILIKPNVCGLYHPSLNLLQGLLEYLEPRADRVIIGETRSALHNPEEQFERLGIRKLVGRFGGRVEALDLSADRRVRVDVPNPHALRELELPETLIEADVLINVPKVGRHPTTVLTNALKNLFGLLPHKHKYIRYHPLGVDNVIADIAQVVRPDLNVVDVGDKVMLGVDALRVDVVACKFLGLDPLRVKHLRLVSEDRGNELEELVEGISILEL